ncbi:Mediator of RNA polymerase II transcription subunit 23, partial [Paramuricea clavata]
WSKHTLEHFPYSIQQFFTQHTAPMESKPALKQRVEEEYNKFKNMKSQAEVLNYFGEANSPNIFVCIIWKCLLETGRVNQICLQVLVKLGARALSKQIRVFADFVIHDYSLLSNGSSEDHTKRITCLHDMVWKYHIISIDRLVLCLMLRYCESKEAQVCNLLLRFLLLKIPAFRDRIHTFVQEVPPDYWKHSDWHQKHQAYHQKWGEKFYFEGLREATNASSHNVAYLPINFGNVCLRFLPVLDVVIHRFIELPPVSAGLESLLHNFGALYKFHDRPITYLYNTLYYYNHMLNQRQASRKKLVSVVIGAFANIRPPNWCLSNVFLENLNTDSEWKPNLEYYCGMVGRLVDTISGNSPFPAFDWRFHEFPSPSAHALYATCVELMSLPVNDKDIGKALFSILYQCAETSRGFEILNNSRTWINAIALILSSLPESYCKVVPQLISEALTNDLAVKDVTPITATLMPENMVTPSSFSYSFYSFQSNAAACSLTLPDLVVAFANAVWYHSSLGHLSLIPGLLRDTFKPLIQNEAQFLFACRLLGPFLFRFYSEKPRCLLEIAKELYAILDVVDKKCPHLYHIDTICDFFYHIKYMFVGDSIKQDIQHYIASLRPVLRNRMQFIAHVGHAREDTASVST